MTARSENEVERTWGNEMFARPAITNQYKNENSKLFIIYLLNSTLKS